MDLLEFVVSLVNSRTARAHSETLSQKKKKILLKNIFQSTKQMTVTFHTRIQQNVVME